MTDLKDIWKPTFAELPTVFGTLHMCGFMNLFGAAFNYPNQATKSMVRGTESSVHYVLNAAVKN